MRGKKKEEEKEEGVPLWEISLLRNKVNQLFQPLVGKIYKERHYSPVFSPTLPFHKMKILPEQQVAWTPSFFFFFKLHGEIFNRSLLRIFIKFFSPICTFFFKFLLIYVFFPFPLVGDRTQFVLHFSRFDEFSLRHSHL